MECRVRVERGALVINAECAPPPFGSEHTGGNSRGMGGEEMCSTCARNVRRQRWANAGGGAFNRRIRRCRAGMAGGLPTCLMKPGLGCVWLVCPPPPPAQSPFDRQALPYEDGAGPMRIRTRRSKGKRRGTRRFYTARALLAGRPVGRRGSVSGSSIGGASGCVSCSGCVSGFPTLYLVSNASTRLGSSSFAVPP